MATLEEIKKQLNASTPVVITETGEIVKKDETTTDSSGNVQTQDSKKGTVLKATRWYSHHVV